MMDLLKKLPLTALILTAAVWLLTGSETASLIVFGISVLIWAVRKIRSGLSVVKSVEHGLDETDC